MSQKPIVIFVCEHGAAKSIIAAAYFNKFAREANLEAHAIARGTNPDQKLSRKTVAGLRHDGLLPTESVPQKLTLADVESARYIVSFCEIPEEYLDHAVIEQWNDIPPVRENYEKARNMIVARLKPMMNDTV